MLTNAMAFVNVRMLAVRLHKKQNNKEEYTVMRTRIRAIGLLIFSFTIVTGLISGCDSQKNEQEVVKESPVITQPEKPESTTPEPMVEQAQAADNQDEYEKPSWSQHVVSYDQGWISSEQPIIVHFAHDVISQEQLNQKIEGVVNISPHVELDAVFQNTDQLSLIPSQRLPSGQAFSISLPPEKFEGVPENLGPLKFQVQVLKQEYELRVSGLVPGANKGSMTLTGSIRTADTVENKEIEKTLSLVQKEQNLNVQWQHSNDRLNHSFTIEGILRGEKTEKVELHYSAANLGVDKQGVHTIDVPALDQFSVTALRTVQHPDQYVEVSFSEALDRNQNLNGLVRLAGKPSRVRVDGSYLRIYPSGKQSGVLQLEIDDTIKSTKKIPLAEAYKGEVTFISELPGVRFTGKGSIIPPGKDLRVPFEAINVNAVWVTAFKVFEENIPQFLQNYNVTSSSLDNRSGRYLWRKKITLPSVPFDQWQSYDIDMNELMDKHEGSIVNLTLSIDQSTTAYNCPDAEGPKQETTLQNYEGPQMVEYEQRPEWFRKYYSKQNGYVTRAQRRDPCHFSYYNYYGSQNVRTSKNFLVSDIGLMVKKGSSHQLHIVATGIQSGKPEKNTRIHVYNYQHQLLASGSTDSKGMITLKPSSAGFYIVAEKGKDRGYIRLPRNEALPTSLFDTGGEKVSKGIKGFIYGERDVWRPGDNIYLTFVLQDKENRLPEGHPVSIDFFDPRGTKVTTQTNSSPVGDLYTFALRTEESSPTGSWRAVVRVGGEYFDKVIKIETIVPNRLKVDITPAETPIKAAHAPLRAELFAQWLNGAKAGGLRADSEMKLVPKKTQFDGWNQYIFDDPASSFKQYKNKVFSGQLDKDGRAAFNLNLDRIRQAPGKLKATFVTRVFEKSGNFSTAIRSEEVLPYENWVGLNIPKGSGYRDAIARDKDHTIHFLSLDSDAKPVAKRKLNLSVYKISWRWWWDQSEENLANYVRGRHSHRLINEDIETDEKGLASWLLEKNKYKWGRHLIRVCDTESGHCAGKEVYLGWSWSNQVNPDAATQLMLATDKERYTVGDTARIKIPELAQGTILYSIENGSDVLQQKWLDLKPGATSFDIPITADMSPNVYVNAVLLLPQAERKSDAPIRLYGITPLLVDDPDSRIVPVIESPESVRPSSSFEVTISEKNNRTMSYTLAVVDEGLLGITGYNAPDPHDKFYRREALGVMTWDIFDGVIGAYEANLQRLLRIGGGDGGKGAKRKKQRRFPPVVKFLGAFTLPAGETKKHVIELPQYMGAVRVMAVAADEGAYGKAEKTVTVTQPLTLLATLPRVLGPNEKVSLPVNVFVNNKTIREVEVKVTSDDLFTVKEPVKTLHFDSPGDQIAMLELEVNNKVGMGTVTVEARSGDEFATQTIHIESRSANVMTSMQKTKLLQPGEVWVPSVKPHGMDNTNTASISVGSFPPLNLDHRLGYLIRYPHGCLEQTTSAIFPQLWLNNLIDLSEKQKLDIQDNVDTAVNKFRGFQSTAGNFSYWPGQSYSNDWASTYVTHFLVEAKELGYAVPQNMLDDALKYLRGQASSFNEKQQYARLVSAYQLYVLAISGTPDLASMNRLRENLLRDKDNEHVNQRVARWNLAAAYQVLGLQDVAQELVKHAQNQIEEYRAGNYTYGSSVRDRAMLLLTYHQLQDETAAWDEAEELARLLSQRNWYSTHSTAWALLALSKYAKDRKGESHQFSISEIKGAKPVNHQQGFSWEAIESIATIYQQPIAPESLAQSSFAVRNDSDRPLHAQITTAGIPAEGQEEAFSKGLTLDVTFTDMEGNALDVKSLPQGQDFIAEVTISSDWQRHSYKIEDIAMTMVMPSGWQIRNERLEGDALQENLDYQDIRDDRVLSYFSLWKNYYWYYRYNDRNRNEQTIRVTLNASYAGRFYLPGWEVASMYDDDIKANNVGQWVEVVAESEDNENHVNENQKNEKTVVAASASTAE